MPHAVTHVLIVVVFLELYRHYFVKNKSAFPLHYVLIGGLAGLLPDIDIFAYYILSFFGFGIDAVHRTFTHTLFFPAVFALLALPFSKLHSKNLRNHHLKAKNIMLVISFGIFVHLLLDFLLAGYIAPLFPLIKTSFGLNLVALLPLAWQQSFLPSIDAFLLVAWLVSLEIRHKLSSFI